MGLTREQRNQAFDTIKNTRQDHGAFTYPPECHAFPNLCGRETVNMTVGGHAFKFYVMAAHNRKPGCPVHINIHGGGFLFPHGENDTMYSAYIAHGIEGVVVDVDYTTSDVAPWPAAFDQCYEVARYVFVHCEGWECDPKRVSMGGYSAGGSLTAGVALKAVDTGDFSLALQILGYPLLDSLTHPLFKKNGYFRVMPWQRDVAFNTLYFDGDRQAALSPYASPVLSGNEELSRLPRTLVCSAASCNFRFENEEYARRLASLGVEVTVKRFPGTNHGFIPHFMPGWEDASALIIRTIKSASLKDACDVDKEDKDAS